MNETVQEMVEKWLSKNGYDGLFNADGPCGCLVGDLMPCDEPVATCEAGYKGPCNPDDCEFVHGCDWHIYSKKQETPKKEEPDGR